jgi:hypothetical protein
MTTLAGEAQEVALAEAQAVLAMARDDDVRGRLAELVSQAEQGEVDDAEADLLEQVLELGLQAGRIRAHYGPGGEQAAMTTLRRLPRGRARTASAGDVSKALAVLRGETLERLSITANAPGSYTLAIGAGGLEATIRLDGAGARLVSLES